MRCLITFLIALISVASHADEDIRHYFVAWNSGYRLPVHGDYLFTATELQNFYQQHKYSPVWYSGGEPTAAATEVYQAVQTAAADGLLPQDYHSLTLQEFCFTGQRESLGYCDLLLSDAFLLFAQHLLAGKVNPEILSPGLEPGQRQRDLVWLLETALADSNIKSKLEGLRPDSLGYARLKAALRRLRAATDYPAWPALPISPDIQPDEEDKRLAAIVERLVFWGDMQAPTAPVTHYNEAIQTAIERFQKRHGLPPTAVIGPQTFEALNVVPTQRAQQIVVNLERWRWLDEDLGPTYLLVNLAERRLRAVKNNQQAFSQAIAVSRHYYHTPLFSDSIRYLVLNPAWVVPKRLAARYHLPIIQGDPDYLSRLGFSVFSGNERVAPETIVWPEVSPENFAYRLVQSPGPRNALGQVKFMFPNDYHVYLHDSPAENIFQEAQPGFDAGSIRVTQPVDLAVWLLGGDAATANARVKDLLKKGAPEVVYLIEPVPVHITYKTAWVNSKGILNFREDVYQRDEPLYEALVQPLSGRPK